MIGANIGQNEAVVEGIAVKSSEFHFLLSSASEVPVPTLEVLLFIRQSALTEIAYI